MGSDNCDSHDVLLDIRGGHNPADALVRDDAKSYESLHRSTHKSRPRHYDSAASGQTTAQGWLSLGLFSMMGMISSEWNPSGGMPLIISMLRMRNSLENRKVIKTAFILCVWITDLDPRSLINVLSDESPKLSLIT